MAGEANGMGFEKDEKEILPPSPPRIPFFNLRWAALPRVCLLVLAVHRRASRVAGHLEAVIGPGSFSGAPFPIETHRVWA
jgi:hypothetical protein